MVSALTANGRQERRGSAYLLKLQQLLGKRQEAETEAKEAAAASDLN